MGRRKKNDNPIVNLQTKHKTRYNEVRQMAKDKGFDLFYFKYDSNYLYIVTDGNTNGYTTDDLDDVAEFIETHFPQSPQIQKMQKLLEKYGGKLINMHMPDGAVLCRIANVETGFLNFDTEINTCADLTAEVIKNLNLKINN